MTRTDDEVHTVTACVCFPRPRIHTLEEIRADPVLRRLVTERLIKTRPDVAARWIREARDATA